MNPLSFEYKISVREYHSALYFGLATRYRNMLRIFIVVSAVALICYLGGLFGIIPVIAFPSYIFLGYLVWLSFSLARIEHGVLKMLKNPQNPLRTTIRLEVVRDQLKVETPHNHEKASHQLSQLFLVFELSNLFLIYLDPINTIILPHRTMDAAQRSALRERFQAQLHDRFQSRFGYLKAPKLRPLTGQKKKFF